MLWNELLDLFKYPVFPPSVQFMVVEDNIQMQYSLPLWVTKR